MGARELVTRCLLPVALMGALAYGALKLDLFDRIPLPFVGACSSPVEYRIGRLDAGFNLSEAELSADLEEAAGLWNEAAGRTIVRFSEDGAVPVNLLYGERQQTIELGRAIEGEQSAHDAKKAEVDRMRAAYQAEKAAHERRVAAFDAETDAYNREVAYWNARGGASGATYDALHRRQSALATEQVTINQEVVRLNSRVAELNAATDELNALARNTNAKVRDYNAEAGEDFDQGNYVSDASGKRIIIYEFTDEANLKRVLAHEIGHALGLGHVAGEESIMYPKNSGDSFVLSAEDRAELKRVCKF
jgi:hypothetical protein